MADIEHQVIVKNNLVEVFKTATAFEDDETLKQWQTGVKTVGVTAGDPLRAGSMIGMKKQFMVSEIFVNVDVTDLQRNKRIAYKGVHGRFPYNREIEFVSSGRETQINDRINLKTGWLFFWWRPFAINALRSQTANEWNNLKKMLDR